MSCYLDDGNKDNCFGCEACVQICPKGAISMVEDEEGFRYPKIDEKNCIHCNLCRKICPYCNEIIKKSDEKYSFGGYINDYSVREKSTSGGAFTAIAKAFCDKNYVICGAESKGLKVFHSFIDNIEEIDKFRKSKYSQSIIGNSYKEVLKFLKEGKKVLFSGTPCQVNALNVFLKNKEYDNLLTVEVICEGVPSPLYVRKFDDYINGKYNYNIKSIDYRYSDNKKILCHKYGKWDFQVMQLELQNGKILKKDRWFNPFWNIWLKHLMSRPSCYHCPFTTTDRCADITLGDLWGVHLYCPELYGNNGGSSLVVCNSEKGKKVFSNAKKYMYGHELSFNDALKYQSPMRKSIDNNPLREEFIEDLKNKNVLYSDIVKKWYDKPTLKLLYQKYIWGNRQKIFVWNLKNRGEKNERND